MQKFTEAYTQALFTALALHTRAPGLRQQSSTSTWCLGEHRHCLWPSDDFELVVINYIYYFYYITTAILSVGLRYPVKRLTSASGLAYDDLELVVINYTYYFYLHTNIYYNICCNIHFVNRLTLSCQPAYVSQSTGLR